ncbi:MAG TPA: IS256 family transposase [Armatimonadota bacterium]
MAYREDCSLPEGLLEQIAERGLDGLGDAIALLVNAAMQYEREAHLQAGPYERNPGRVGHSNGYKPKTVQTRVGEVTFAVPQVREGGFYPRALEKGLRSERALTIALAEMYVQGVSTRKVSKVIEELCGCEVTSTQVSRAAAELDAALSAWRNRPLGLCPYLYLDARYEKVRRNGTVQDAAVLIAVGVDAIGFRAVLGVSVSLSEHEAHWRSFLLSLVERGLSGVQLVVSDDHAGLKAARSAVLGGVPWQRCQFHLQQNAQAYVPKVETRAEVAKDIRAVFNAGNRTEADQLLKACVARYEKTASKLSCWLEENLPEGLMVFAFPEEHWKKLRTSNGLERINQEIRRRTRVARLFPNEESLLRLVSAVLMEISDDWQTDKRYVTFPS